jgi:hypothetical protein
VVAREKVEIARRPVMQAQRDRDAAAKVEVSK